MSEREIVKEMMATKPIDIIWKGKKLVRVYGTSVEDVTRQLLTEGGMSELPPKTSVFEAML